MAVSRERSPEKSAKRTGRLANIALSVALLGGAGAGLGYTIYQLENTSPENAPVQIEPAPTPPLLSQQEIKDMNNVPLAEITKEMGVMRMAKIDKNPTAEFPYSWDIIISNATIVNVSQDQSQDAYWVALALPGERINRTASGQSVVNFDGSKTELESYSGFTAWVELTQNSVSIFNNSHNGQTGLDHITPYLIIGKPLSLIIDPNQYEPNYKAMDINSLSLLNKNINKPNIERSDNRFKFTADRVYIYTSNY